MIDTLQKILALFTPKERRQLAGVLFAIMMTGLLQVAGVGSVVPFLSLLTDPSFIHSSAPIASIYQGLGFDSDQSFIIFFGFIVLFLLIAGNAFIAFTLWVIARFSWSNQRRLSVRLMTRYLAQPYETLMNRNTADTGKNILLESQQFTQGVLIQVLNLLAFGVTVAMMVILLLVLNPLLATATGVVFGGIYLLAYMLMRRPLLRLCGYRS